MKVKLTGHDTFPLRYGWPFKTVNYIKNNGLLSSSDNVRASKAVSSLGVGKNMINAMRYWSEAAMLTTSSTEGAELAQSATELRCVFTRRGRWPRSIPGKRRLYMAAALLAQF